MRFLIIVSLFIQSLTFANDSKPTKINWVSFEKAIELNKVNPKPIIIDIYATWCGPCKQLDKVTFNNPVISKYINEHYYAVKFNGEQKEPLTYRGKTYYNPNRQHQFTPVITNNSHSYPTITFLNKNEEMLQAIPSFLPPKQMEMILHFFGEELYLTQKWEVFEKEFKSEL